MKSIEDYLDDLRKIKGSDYAIAKALGLTQASIIKIKKGGGIKDETALKIAELLKIDDSEVLMAAAIARSEGKVKSAWENISKKAGMAAGLVFAIEVRHALENGVAAINEAIFCVLC